MDKWITELIGLGVVLFAICGMLNVILYWNDEGSTEDKEN